MPAEPSPADLIAPLWGDRLAILANGDTVPLPEAAAHYGLLRSYSHTDWLAWDPLPLLRDLCLGRTVDPEQRRELERHGVLPAGEPLPDVLRSVVLASVRGTGDRLTVDCPFVDETDRVLAAFDLAREDVRSHLDPAEAAAFLRHDPPQDTLDEHMWELHRRDEPDGADPESIAKRIIRLAAERKADPPGSPPPLP